MATVVGMIDVHIHLVAVSCAVCGEHLVCETPLVGLWSAAHLAPQLDAVHIAFNGGPPAWWRRRGSRFVAPG